MSLTVKILVICGIFFAMLSIVLTFYYQSKFSAPTGYTRTINYLPPGKTNCQALKPECGYCPGILKRDICYIKKQP